MKRIFVNEIFADLNNYNGKKMTVCGWIRNLRIGKDFGFINLNDGSCLKNVQIVFERQILTNYDEIASQNVGAALVVEGMVSATPNMKQPFEIKAENVTVEGVSTPDYPIQPKRHTAEFLRTQAYLRARTNLYSAVFRVRSRTAYAIHRFFNERGFVYVNTPIITGSDCEGAGEMFRITTLDFDNLPKKDDGSVDFGKDFFGKSTNLTVSGQLEGETYAMAFGKIYTFGPTFRAENSNTARHAAEFWMVEPEIAFADLNDDMELAWDMICYIINDVLGNCADEMEFFNTYVDKGLLQRLNALSKSKYTKITYTEAVKLLRESGHDFKYKPEWGLDLQTEHERYITEKIFDGPVFVTDYPKQIKSFYMRVNDDKKTVAAMDLLVPGVGEIIGGSQREERLDVLLARMQEMGLNEKDYKWYVNLRRYGSAKHSGFGLGFERMVMYLTGVSNIRDVIPYPRTVGSAEF